MLNARSLVPKFDELCVVVAKLKPDIVLVTETWLNDHVEDNFLSLPHYNIFRHDRQYRRGGGVGLWIHEKFNSIVVSSMSCTPSIECLFIEARINSRHVYLFSVRTTRSVKMYS